MPGIGNQLAGLDRIATRTARQLEFVVDMEDRALLPGVAEAQPNLPIAEVDVGAGVQAIGQGTRRQRFGTECGQSARRHEGRVAVSRSDLRWCSNGLEIKCDSGQTVTATFTKDCCDREVMAWRAWEGKGLPGEPVREMLIEAVERRFGAVEAVPTDHALEFLSDNGGAYIAAETRALARALGLKPINTPVCSPQSNGMAESFVNTFKRDYVARMDRRDARTVLEQLSDFDPVFPAPSYSQYSAWFVDAACCHLNSRGEHIFSEECGCTSLKCSKAAGSCFSTVRASRRSIRATYSRLKVFTKLPAMPLLCGLQTGVLMGLRPNARASARVSAAM